MFDEVEYRNRQRDQRQGFPLGRLLAAGSSRIGMFAGIACLAFVSAMVACSVRVGGGSSQAEAPPGSTGGRISAAAEAACVPSCTDFPEDVEDMYDVVEDHRQDGLSSDQAVQAVLDVIAMNHPDSGDGPSRAELCEPCVQTVASEVYAGAADNGTTPPSGPDQQPPSIVDPVVVVEPAPAGESYVTVSCMVQGGQDDVSAVEADLSGIGGAGWEALESLQEGDSRGEYMWQGYVVLPEDPATTVAFRATDVGGQVTNVPAVPVEFRATSDPDIPTVVLSAEQIAGPGGALLYHGREFAGDVEVPADTLVGVLRGDQAFLYHPALGDVELTEETSRLALAYFALDLGTNGEPAPQKSVIRLSKSVTVGETIKVGNSGITIRITSKDDSGVVEFSAYNPTKRWVAIKTSEPGSPRFAPARNNRTETNLLRWLWRQGLPYCCPDPAGGQPIPIYSVVTSRHRIKARVGTEVEVFGAWWRTLGALPGWKVETALGKDQMLCLRLNVIDMAYVLLEQMRILFGIGVVHECGDLIVDALFGTSQAIVLTMLTDDTETWLEFLGKTGADTVQNLVLCIANFVALATPPTAAVATVIGTLLDIGNYIVFVKEDVVEAVRDVLVYDAYSSLDIEEETEPNGDTDDDGALSARDLSGCWKLSLTVEGVVGTGTLIFEIDANGQLERTWRVEPSSPTRTVETGRFTVPEPPIWQSIRRSVSQSITVTADGQVEIKATVEDNGYSADANGVCKVNKSYWTRGETTIRATIVGDPPSRLDAGTVSTQSFMRYPDRPELDTTMTFGGTVAGTRESACPNPADANVYSLEEWGSPCRRW